MKTKLDSNLQFIGDSSIKKSKKKKMVSIKVRTVVTFIREGGGCNWDGAAGALWDAGKVLFLNLSDSYMKPCYVVMY